MSGAGLIFPAKIQIEPQLSLEQLLEKARNDSSIREEFVAQLNAKYNSSNNQNFPHINEVIYSMSGNISASHEDKALARARKPNVVITNHFFECKPSDEYGVLEKNLEGYKEFFTGGELDLLKNLASSHLKSGSDDYVVKKEDDIVMILLHENKHLEPFRRDAVVMFAYDIYPAIEEVMAHDHAFAEQKIIGLNPSPNFIDYVKLSYFGYYKMAKTLLLNELQGVSLTDKPYPELQRLNSILNNLNAIPRLTTEGINLEYKK